MTQPLDQRPDVLALVLQRAGARQMELDLGERDEKRALNIHYTDSSEKAASRQPTVERPSPHPEQRGKL
jgi:hypothetical protein